MVTVFGRDMSEKHSIHRVCHRIVRPRAPKAVEETYWENAIVICDVRWQLSSGIIR